MSVRIDAAKCVGCGACAEICPGALFALQGGQAVLTAPERCWGCCACVKECPAQAIAFFLGEDIGGLGGRLTVRREGALLHWRAVLPDGICKEITVDSTQSNQY